MTNYETLEGLRQAALLLDQKKRELCREPFAIYQIVYHAYEAVHKQLAAMLRGDSAGRPE